MGYNPSANILTEVPGALNVQQTTTPVTLPAAGYDLLYFKSDDKLYRLTSGGLEAAVGNAGTVTSVNLADGSATPIYFVTGSPITSSGTLTFTLSAQPINVVFAGPASGLAAQPTFRPLIMADLPSLSGTYATVTLNNLTTTAINANLLFGADNTNSVGAAGASRPSVVYAGTSVRPAFGTVSAPSHSFDGEINTGFYRSASGEVSFASLGVQQIRFATDSFGGGAIWLPSELSQVLVGGTTSDPWAAQATAGIASSLYGPQFVAAGAGGNTPGVILRQSNGTLAVPTATTSGQFIGFYRMTGYTGSGYVGGAASIQMLGAATENWTPTATGSNFFIDTTPTGTTGVVATVGIMNDGSLTMRRNSAAAAIVWGAEGVSGVGLSNNTFRPGWINASLRVEAGTPNGVNPSGAIGQIRAFQQGAQAIILVQSNSTNVPVYKLRQGNGTLAVPTATTNGQQLGVVGFDGHTGAAFAEGAGVVAVATANWTGSLTPTSLFFRTSNTVSGVTTFTSILSAADTGAITLLKSTGANLLWNTDNVGGDLGTPDGGTTFNRPGKAYIGTFVQVGNVGQGIQLTGAMSGATGTIQNNGPGFTFDSSAQATTSLRGITMQTFNLAFNDGGAGSIGRNIGGLGTYQRPFLVASYNAFHLGGTYFVTDDIDFQPTWQKNVASANGTPITTTNATATSLYTYSMRREDNTVVTAKAYIVARRTDSADRAYFETTAMAYREAGGNIVIEASSIDYSIVTGTSAAWTVSWTVSNVGVNHQLIVQVTGAAGQTIDWNGSVDVHLVS